MGLLYLLPVLLSFKPGGFSQTHQLAELEKHSGGRLGVAVIDFRTGKSFGYHSDQRFLMCSTFKLLAVAAVLKRVDQGRESLNRHVPYGTKNLLSYAPTTTKNVGRGYMTVAELCEAAIELSDNTAANLLLGSLGGPQKVTAFCRSLGDPKTHLDRTEPTLNDPSGDLDTTTPMSMGRDVRKLVFGAALSKASSGRLEHWMVHCQTSATLLRAGVPKGWVVGDKSGMGGKDNRFGDSDTRNDVSVLWSPNGVPRVVVVYLTGCQLPAKKRDAVVAEVGRIVTRS